VESDPRQEAHGPARISRKKMSRRTADTRAERRTAAPRRRSNRATRRSCARPAVGDVEEHAAERVATPPRRRTVRRARRRARSPGGSRSRDTEAMTPNTEVSARTAAVRTPTGIAVDRVMARLVRAAGAEHPPRAMFDGEPTGGATIFAIAARTPRDATITSAVAPSARSRPRP